MGSRFAAAFRLVRRACLIARLPHRGLRRRPELLHLGLHGLDLRPNIRGLNLCGLLQILGPHEPLGVVQRGPQVLLGRGQGLLGQVLGPGLTSIACLLHGLGRAPGGSQEAVQCLVRLGEALLGEGAHFLGDLEACPFRILVCVSHRLISLEGVRLSAGPSRSKGQGSRSQQENGCAQTSIPLGSRGARHAHE